MASEPVSDKNQNDQVNPDIIIFPAGASGQSVTVGHDTFAPRNEPPPQPRNAYQRVRGAAPTEELMGPILRRKKVVSLPLGAGGDFFFTVDENPGPHRQILEDYEKRTGRRVRTNSFDPNRQRQKQNSLDSKLKQAPASAGDAAAAAGLANPPSPRSRQRQTTPQQQFLRGIVRRRQVSLDLLGPNDFFGVPEEIQAPNLVEDECKEASDEVPTMIEEEEGDKVTGKKPEKTIKDLFFPLRFAPRQRARTGASGGHGGGHDSGHGGGGGGHSVVGHSVAESEIMDQETHQVLERYVTSHEQIKANLLRLSKAIPEEKSGEMSELISKMDNMDKDHATIKKSLVKQSRTIATPSTHPTDSSFYMTSLREDETDHIGVDGENGDEHGKDHDYDKEECGDDDEEDAGGGVVRAGRSDKIKALICFFVMLALTLVVTLWETHPDEDIFILTPVGLACVTSCPGNLETRDFFFGHNHFQHNEVIDLLIHLDQNEIAAEHHTHARVEIVGLDTGLVKAVYEFGPIEAEERITLTHDIVVDFENPEEAHVINVTSTEADLELSFTLLAEVKKPLARYSVAVAAAIMVFVYFFILLEIIHRALIAIYGSMIALMFYFIMSGGHVESIRVILIHLEWSTLGLLFGMMLIVGELSHTGVFEWCAVRILIFSKGSYVRLLVLLGVLTAVASAFLDNVTTVLLIAPVTIDMCHIVGDIDPRPYLIAEVLLSNIGGTGTMIGDPPNIILGSSFSDIIGFVDFIIHVAPVIFVFCVPISLGLVVYIYRWYLTSSKMRVLDTAVLKKTYRIYDEPRLLISGTVTVFVILMFFLHPVHHKDTAWIALLGAFVTLAFTNPHDIQSALRSHIEWDTLLFFAGLFVLVEVCAAMGLLKAIGDTLASYISSQPEEKQLTVAITLILWVSAIASSFLDNIPYTATMIPVITILSLEMPDTLPLETLIWALSLGACLGGNGTLLGASANIVTAGISTNKGYEISFVNFLYPGMLTMFLTVAVANLYMLVRYVWAA